MPPAACVMSPSREPVPRKGASSLVRCLRRRQAAKFHPFHQACELSEPPPALWAPAESALFSGPCERTSRRGRASAACRVCAVPEPSRPPRPIAAARAAGLAFRHPTHLRCGMAGIGLEARLPRPIRPAPRWPPPPSSRRVRLEPRLLLQVVLHRRLDLLALLHAEAGGLAELHHVGLVVDVLDRLVAGVGHLLDVPLADAAHAQQPLGLGELATGAAAPRRPAPPRARASMRASSSSSLPIWSRAAARNFSTFSALMPGICTSTSVEALASPWRLRKPCA